MLLKGSSLQGLLKRCVLANYSAFPSAQKHCFLILISISTLRAILYCSTMKSAFGDICICLLPRQDLCLSGYIIYWLYSIISWGKGAKSWILCMQNIPPLNCESSHGYHCLFITTSSSIKKPLLILVLCIWITQIMRKCVMCLHMLVKIIGNGAWRIDESFFKYRIAFILKGAWQCIVGGAYSRTSVIICS